MSQSLPAAFTKVRPFLILYILTSFFISDIHSQVFNYDFATVTGNFFTPGTSTGFLPAAPNGTAQVLVSDGGGGFTLTKPGTSIGSGSELQMFSSSNNSRNKMGISGYTAGRSSYVKFTMMLSGNSGGDWYFYMGSGASFSDENAIDPNEAFTGIRWNIDDMGTISAWVHTGSGWQAFPDGSFQQDREYTFEFFANNFTSQLYYDKNGGHYVSEGSCDIWVNNSLAMAHVEKLYLPEDSGLDSWMFYGENSNNNGMMAIDDIQYSNNITMKTLPVHFSHVAAQAVTGGIQVSWENSTEDNIRRYEIERSSDARNFSAIGQQAPSGNSGRQSAYRFMDAAPLNGLSYYRIRSIELDGSISWSPVMRINTLSPGGELSVYPNPVRDRRIFLEFSSLPKGSYEIVVTDVQQRPCLQRSVEHGQGAQTESLELPASLPAGIYQVTISNRDKVYHKTIVVH